jgi:hypothetical protein
VPEKKASPREISPYDPSAVSRLIKVTTAETGLARRGDAYDLSRPASRIGSSAQKSKG